ncbi:MAG: LytTR family DNA-binding domain-containing protein [Salinivirgaceae bacterium]|nr:LytTR family DNA-binding domain-containing protein [Salinivirgaceae bacterium]
MYKIAIIDDEFSGRDIVRHNLRQYSNVIELIADADSVQSGVKLIDTLKPDIVFLDIQMQDGTGFDLLQQVQERNFKVVFVTSFDNFAIKAIKFNAADYLLKPIDPDMFEEAFEKVLNSLKDRQVYVSVEQFNNNFNKFDKIGLMLNDCIKFVPIDSIVFCAAEGNYSKFRFCDDIEDMLVCRNLKYYEDILPENKFIRVSRSNIININKVDSFVKGEVPVVVMADGTQIEVSRRRKDPLFEMLNVKI